EAAGATSQLCAVAPHAVQEVLFGSQGSEVPFCRLLPRHISVLFDFSAEESSLHFIFSHR
ncbi:hypothetical protein FKZ61_015900, partial [Litorilinea aerophila]|uniref:hypothetical protein n=1 Tax=Litorilinea aerophila TaxID=1204385 RepID=UPI001B863031